MFLQAGVQRTKRVSMLGYVQARQLLPRLTDTQSKTDTVSRAGGGLSSSVGGYARDVANLFCI